MMLWGAAQHDQLPAEGNQRRPEDREAGAEMIEYCLMVLLIVFIAMIGVKFYGQRSSKPFSNIGKTVNDLMP
jgi:hypothetical protein